MYLLFTRAMKILSKGHGFGVPFHCGAGTMVDVWKLWWVSEVSECEFIEYLFFMTALLSGASAGGKLSLYE
jgi:hypothetical protein